MTKYLSVIVGSCVAILGLFGIIGWWSDLITVVKGSIPAMLVFGGVIAVIAGISELRDKAVEKENTK